MLCFFLSSWMSTHSAICHSKFDLAWQIIFIPNFISLISCPSYWPTACLSIWLDVFGWAKLFRCSQSLFISTSACFTYRVSQKKRNIRGLCSFCLISLATINLQSCDIFQMKGDIQRYVMSTNSFLSDIGELRYRQNNIGCQIIEIVKYRLISYL